MDLFQILCQLCLFRGPEKGPSVSAPCELCKRKGKPYCFRIDGQIRPDKREELLLARIREAAPTAEDESTLATALTLYCGCAICTPDRSCSMGTIEDCIEHRKKWLRSRGAAWRS